MFSSRRKSRIVEPGPLPGNNSLNVNSNALAAATAIGQALKTGQPIPRSNSLQRSASFQRTSLQNGKPGARTSSLMSSSFSQRNGSLREPSTSISRSHSISSNQGTKLILPPKPKAKTIKKHIPGPHGLITIEVPITEEEEEPPSRTASFTSTRSKTSVNRKPSTANKRNSVLAKPKIAHSTTNDMNSMRSLNSLNSASRKPILQEPIQEGEATDFKSPTILESVTDIDLPKTNEDFEACLDEIVEEEPVSVVEDADLGDLKELRNQKEYDEEKIVNDLSHQEEEVNNGLNNQKVATNDSLDQYTDAPSTGKSQSSNDDSTLNTELSEQDNKSHAGPFSNGSKPELNSGNTMAQQLRPTIPSFVFSSHEQLEETTDALQNTDMASSVYSSDLETSKPRLITPEPEPEFVTPPQQPSVEQLNEAKSTKRELVAPKKSALKYKTSTSSINLIESPNSKNAAADAYISLTTAENTRLNALLANNTASLSRSRSNSRTNGFVQVNTNQKPKRPQSAVVPNESPSKVKSLRPQSVQPQQFQQQQRQPGTWSASNAAAVNATKKKNEIPKPIERTSSFEKLRNADSNAAFKKKSLRDPSFGAHPPTVESNLGFYRNQAATQQKIANVNSVAQQKIANGNPAARQPGYYTEQPVHNPTPSSGNNGSRFKSRFEDSDDEDAAPIKAKNLGNGFNDNVLQSQTLKRPKSQFTLRSSSNNASFDKSPAKSLPDDQRKTRFFSDTTQFTPHRHHNTPMDDIKEEKKKTSFGGKLKKLFGRNKD